jgi:hypothetical protein
VPNEKSKNAKVGPRTGQIFDYKALLGFFIIDAETSSLEPSERALSVLSCSGMFMDRETDRSGEPGGRWRVTARMAPYPASGIRLGGGRNVSPSSFFSENNVAIIPLGKLESPR